MKSVVIGMELVNLLSVVSTKILIQEESETAFAKPDKQTFFCMDFKCVKLNILRLTLQSLLQASEYSQFKKHLNNYCELLFPTFDEDFLNLNLLKK